MAIKTVSKRSLKPLKPRVVQAEEPKQEPARVVEEPEIEAGDDEDNLDEEQLASLQAMLQAFGGGSSSDESVQYVKRIAQELHALNKSVGAIASIMGHNLRRREAAAKPAAQPQAPVQRRPTK